jgi:hypothetical protein
VLYPRERAVYHLVHAADGGVIVRKQDVPQDGNANLNGARKVVYAVDEDGRYTLVPTTGWEVEEIVTGMAVDRYAELAQEALSRVKQGLASPLEYHMYANRLNVATLAQSAGQFRWQVRRHLRRPIAKLKPKTLRLYAEALGIGVDSLSDIP